MNYAYDPELPYAVVRTGLGVTGVDRPGVIARFRTRRDARDMEGNFQPGYVELVDTTPKPKIPEDAQYVIWRDENGVRWYAEKSDTGSRLVDDGMVCSPEEFEEVIGDAEVTVLVPREDA